jgi:hypothetical protein
MYSRVTIDVTMKHNPAHPSALVGPLMTHFPQDIASLIDGYAPQTYANVDLYASEKYLNAEERKSLIATRHWINIRQFEQDVRRIPAGQTEYTHGLSQGRAAYGLMFFFTRPGCSEPMDILLSGRLELSGYTYAEFTGYSAWVVDKAINDLHIPDKPVYTITFENEDPSDDGSPRGHLCFFSITGANLSVKIASQPVDVELTVVLILHNHLMVEKGMMNIRFA